MGWSAIWGFLRSYFLPRRGTKSVVPSGKASAWTGVEDDAMAGGWSVVLNSRVEGAGGWWRVEGVEVVDVKQPSGGSVVVIQGWGEGRRGKEESRVCPRLSWG